LCAPATPQGRHHAKSTVEAGNGVSNTDTDTHRRKRILNLTPEVENAMIKSLRKAYDYVYKNGPDPNLQIPDNRTNHCAETVSCKSGGDIDFWN
jgi:hypothetical protein